MDPNWPQRPAFKALVKGFRAKHGLSREAMADRLGVKESRLHCLLYDKRTSPSLDFAQRASEVFGVSITEIVDDPGRQAPPGIEQSVWSSVSDTDRVMLGQMAVALLQIPEEQRQLYFDLWLKGVEIARANLAKERGE